MAFDIDMIRKYYTSLLIQVEITHTKMRKILTLAEKILYTHLNVASSHATYLRGKGLGIVFS